MCNNRQHDSENVRLRHENMILASEIESLQNQLREVNRKIHTRNTAQDWPAWRITFQSSDQAGQSAFSMLKQARDEIEGLKLTNKSIVSEIEVLQDEVKELKARKFARFNNDDCWIFEGSEEDHLESLVCPVVISAAELIEIIDRAEKAEMIDQGIA